MSDRNGSQAGTTVYPLRDAAGRLVAEHVREEVPGGGKQVLWRRPDGEWGLNGTPLEALPLYGSEMVGTLDEDDLIVLVEGEKARDALEAAGIPAVGTVTGAGKVPSPEALGVLRGRRVCLWADGDEPGGKHMRSVAEDLRGIALEVLWYTWHEAPTDVKGPDAADHPAVRSRDRKAVDRLLTDLEGAPRWQPLAASPSPSPYKGPGRKDGARERPEVVTFAGMSPPGPRHYLVEDLVLAAYVTLLYGDGGVAKSLLALALALAVAGTGGTWLGRAIENGPVLYLDFELDLSEQHRRVLQLCHGAGIGQPPERLFYMSGLGFGVRETFEAACQTCEERGVRLLVVDSYGVAIQGDAMASRDVIGFQKEVLEPFRALGVAVLVIDHQSKAQTGQSYQSKGAFGSVYKSNLARSVIQAEPAERGEDTLTVRLRQKKHNFGPLAEPFGVRLDFSKESVSLTTVELDAADLAEEATLNAADRVRHALADAPAYPWEIAEATGLALKTVKNELTGLRKRGEVEATGAVDGRAQQVRLYVPASLTYKGDGDEDARSYRVDETVEARPRRGVAAV